ncbi:hypothetical protein GUITHDRAFT_150166 [Guillardia theta CCMP2712]|uniref:Uncharacterized protein n=3 Tax=Guillardia theta TaxID=55529 RepID=L1K183_GUITC|nr:hypothetical protein GUITHDRAFT_150166 [Guillardia theta CCMP2712]EKX54143.1 hypothetical protein GUITHDRAFT_150166 [Guillardia theta CCMP2712]|eukprot:XP_005841123.1 hypothetical protein GUITHDRAFT_150166 [Guillardia theta CCMP2712]
MPSTTPVTKKEEPAKMGGLALPDVVRELLKDPTVLRWDARDGVYEVMHGENFERRFNELRKVRNKVKSNGTERPFSRMYNFFILEQGDKWARTGTRFRPRNQIGLPDQEFLAQVKPPEVRKVQIAHALHGKSSPQFAEGSLDSCVPLHASRIESAKHEHELNHLSVESATQDISSVPLRTPKMMSVSSRKHIHASHGDVESLIPSYVYSPTPTVLGKRGRDLSADRSFLFNEVDAVTTRRLRVVNVHDPSHPSLPVRSWDPLASLDEVKQERLRESHNLDPLTCLDSLDHRGIEHDLVYASLDVEEAVDSALRPVALVDELKGAKWIHQEHLEDPSDGMSSGFPSPEGVASICEDFVGSPLDLGPAAYDAHEELTALICGSHSHSKDGLLLDTLDDAPWPMVDDIDAGW